MGVGRSGAAWRSPPCSYRSACARQCRPCCFPPAPSVSQRLSRSSLVPTGVGPHGTGQEMLLPVPMQLCWGTRAGCGPWGGGVSLPGPPGRPVKAEALIALPSSSQRCPARVWGAGRSGLGAAAQRWEWGGGNRPWRRLRKGPNSSPQHTLKPPQTKQKRETGGPGPGTAVSYPQICRRWAGANSSCATAAGATAQGGGPGLSVGASAAPTEVGGDTGLQERLRVGGRARRGSAVGLSHGSPAPRKVWGGRVGSSPGAMPWVGGTGPSPGDARPLPWPGC